MWKVLGEDKMLGDASRHCLVNINGQWEGLEGPFASPSPTPPFLSQTFPPPTPSPSWGQAYLLSQVSAFTSYLVPATQNIHPTYTHTRHLHRHTHTTRNHPGP